MPIAQAFLFFEWNAVAFFVFTDLSCKMLTTICISSLNILSHFELPYLNVGFSPLLFPPRSDSARNLAKCGNAKKIWGGMTRVGAHVKLERGGIMILYHGSPNKIVVPTFGLGEERHDC